MPDENLEVTGKDVSLLLMVNGQIKQVQDRVTSFNSQPTYDEIQVKHLGRGGSSVGKEFVEWSGTLELVVSDATADEFIDEVNASLKLRVPMKIDITEVIRYRNGTSKVYTYPDVKCEFERSTTRGEANTVTINWKTGLDRIAS